MQSARYSVSPPSFVSSLKASLCKPMIKYASRLQKPIRSYRIACSHHSSDMITRIEPMLSSVGFLSLVSQTGRNLISPCQCCFSCLMKAKRRLSQPVIKSRLPTFSSSGKICWVSPAYEKKPAYYRSWSIRKTPVTVSSRRCSTFPVEMNKWADVFRLLCQRVAIRLG